MVLLAGTAALHYNRTRRTRVPDPVLEVEVAAPPVRRIRL
jgi:hypothetical protein